MNERMDQKFNSVAAAKLRQFELEPTVNVIKINQELRELLCLFLSLESALFRYWSYRTIYPLFAAIYEIPAEIRC